MAQYDDAQKQSNNGYPGIESQQQYGYPNQQQPYMQQQPYGGNNNGMYGGQQGYPAMGTAVGCPLTREQLDMYFQGSGYGQNALAFNAYFVPGTAGNPICKTCQRSLAAHAPSAQTAAAYQNAAIGQAMMAQMAYGGVGLGAGLLAGGAAFAPRQPMNIVNGPQGDVATVAAHRGVLIAVCIMIFVGVFQMIIFSSVGMFKMAPYAIIGPVVVIGVAICLCFGAVTTTILFERNSRNVVITRRRYLLFCCPTVQHTTTSNFGPVQLMATNVRVNRQVYFNVMTVVQGVGEVVLYRGPYFQAQQEFVNWTQYMANLR